MIVKINDCKNTFIDKSKSCSFNWKSNNSAKNSDNRGCCNNYGKTNKNCGNKTNNVLGDVAVDALTHVITNVIEIGITSLFNAVSKRK